MKAVTVFTLIMAWINSLFCETIVSMDPYIEKVLQEFQVPGAAVGVIVDGQVVLMQGYGLRDQERSVKVSEDTVFPIASCTKSFTSYLLGQLADEGKISLDDPVSYYLPELQLFDEKLTSATTVRDLLAHRTGIPRHDVLWVMHDLRRDRVLSLLPHFEPQHPLREKFLYNNFMYSVAGMIIEKVLGCSWEEAVEAKIFNPLKMHHSSSSIEALLLESNRSLPYAEIEGVVKRLDYLPMQPVNPGGGINSTIRDMLLWISLQLSEDDLARHMHSVQMPLSPTAADEEETISGYGMGWLVGTYRGQEYVKHGGLTAGFCAEMALLPQHKIGIVILTNSSTDGQFAINCIRNAIFDRLLDAPHTDWLAKYSTLRGEAKKATQKVPELSKELLPRPLQEYAASFSHPLYGIAEVVVENDRLVCKYANNLIPLQHTHEDHFTGKTPHLLVYGINPYFDFSFSCRLSHLSIGFESFRGAQAITFTKQ